MSAAMGRQGTRESPAGGAAISQAGEQRSTRIESLRALAALAVVGGHIVALPLALGSGAGPANLNLLDKALFGGGFAVFFFFSLTGYLLFWPFAKQLFGGGDSIDLRRYALNRAFRILPLYYAVVVIVLVLQEHGSTPGVWIRFLTLTENFAPATVGQVIGPAWSLVVELQFYLLLPLLAYALGRLSAGSRGRAALLLIGLGLASLALRFHYIYTPDVVDPLWRFNMPATFLFFIPGMCLALVRVAWEERRPGWVRGPLERADLWLLASLPLWAVVVLYRFYLDAAICGAAFLIVGACTLPLRAGRLTNALQWRPLAVLGVASYSLYLWHVPIIDAVLRAGAPRSVAGLAVIAVPLCIAVALTSYALIEAPFLSLRRQWSRSAAPHEETIAAPAGARPATGEAEG